MEQVTSADSDIKQFLVTKRNQLHTLSDSVAEKIHSLKGSSEVIDSSELSIIVDVV